MLGCLQKQLCLKVINEVVDFDVGFNIFFCMLPFYT